MLKLSLFHFFSTVYSPGPGKISWVDWEWVVYRNTGPMFENLEGISYEPGPIFDLGFWGSGFGLEFTVVAFREFWIVFGVESVKNSEVLVIVLIWAFRFDSVKESIKMLIGGFVFLSLSFKGWNFIFKGIWVIVTWSWSFIDGKLRNNLIFA